MVVAKFNPKLLAFEALWLPDSVRSVSKSSLEVLSPPTTMHVWWGEDRLEHRGHPGTTASGTDLSLAAHP